MIIIGLNTPEVTLMLLPGVLVFRALARGPARWFWIGFRVLLAGTATWALAVAINDAARLGTISLPGSRYYPRSNVPWSHAWAYLSGLCLIVIASLAPRTMNSTSQRHGVFALGGLAMIVAGYVLLVIAPLLSSLFLSLAAAFCLALAGLLSITDARFGRAAMWGASALLFAAYCYSLYVTL